MHIEREQRRCWICALPAKGFTQLSGNAFSAPCLGEDIVCPHSATSTRASDVQGAKHPAASERYSTSIHLRPDEAKRSPKQRGPSPAVDQCVQNLPPGEVCPDTKRNCASGKPPTGVFSGGVRAGLTRAGREAHGYSGSIGVGKEVGGVNLGVSAQMQDGKGVTGYGFNIGKSNANHTVGVGLGFNFAEGKYAGANITGNAGKENGAGIFGGFKFDRSGYSGTTLGVKNSANKPGVSTNASVGVTLNKDKSTDTQVSVSGSLGDPGQSGFNSIGAGATTTFHKAKEGKTTTSQHVQIYTTYQTEAGVEYARERLKATGGRTASERSRDDANERDANERSRKEGQDLAAGAANLATRGKDELDAAAGGVEDLGDWWDDFTGSIEDAIGGFGEKIINLATGDGWHWENDAERETRVALEFAGADVLRAARGVMESASNGGTGGTSLAAGSGDLQAGGQAVAPGGDSRRNLTAEERENLRTMQDFLAGDDWTRRQNDDGTWVYVLPDGREYDPGVFDSDRYRYLTDEVMQGRLNLDAAPVNEPERSVSGPEITDTELQRLRAARGRYLQRAATAQNQLAQRETEAQNVQEKLDAARERIGTLQAGGEQAALQKSIRTLEMDANRLLVEREYLANMNARYSLFAQIADTTVGLHGDQGDPGALRALTSDLQRNSAALRWENPTPDAVLSSRFYSGDVLGYDTNGTEVRDLRVRNGIQERHLGIDTGYYRAGDPVRAPQDGVVIRVFDTPDKAAHGNHGNFVEVQHGNGTISRYLHLDGATVREGELIRKGEQLGKLGATGGVPAHLHFEIRRDGRPLNPMDWLPGNSPKEYDGRMSGEYPGGRP